MKILIITPTPTHPTNQGNRARVLQLASAFAAAGSEIDVLYYLTGGNDEDKRKSIHEMRNAWQTLYVVDVTTNFKKSMPNVWGIDDWIAPSLIESVIFLARTVKYDVVVVNYVWCSFLLELFSDEVVKIIDTHDVFSGRHVIAGQVGIDPHWFYTSIEQERIGLNRADIVIAIQYREGEYFKSVSKSIVHVIEYARAPNFLPPRESENAVFGYIGSENPFNVKSVEYLDDIVTQKIKYLPYSNKPKILVFGGITNHLKNMKSVELMGSIDDVLDFYSSIDVAVNPMLGGTGLKIKTVESLSFGIPMLSTESGMAGIEQMSLSIVLSDVKDIADKILDLSNDHEHIKNLSLTTRNQYRNYYNLVQEKILDLIGQVSVILEKRKS